MCVCVRCVCVGSICRVDRTFAAFSCSDSDCIRMQSNQTPILHPDHSAARLDRSHAPRPTGEPLCNGFQDNRHHATSGSGANNGVLFSVCRCNVCRRLESADGTGVSCPHGGGIFEGAKSVLEDKSRTEATRCHQQHSHSLAYRGDPNRADRHQSIQAAGDFQASVRAALRLAYGNRHLVERLESLAECAC